MDRTGGTGSKLANLCGGNKRLDSRAVNYDTTRPFQPFLGQRHSAMLFDLEDPPGSEQLPSCHTSRFRAPYSRAWPTHQQEARHVEDNLLGQMLRVHDLAQLRRLDHDPHELAVHLQANTKRWEAMRGRGMVLQGPRCFFFISLKACAASLAPTTHS